VMTDTGGRAENKVIRIPWEFVLNSGKGRRDGPHEKRGGEPPGADSCRKLAIDV